METAKLIETFAQMNPHDWKALAMKASWHYRTEGEHPMPTKILAVTGGDVPPRDQWDAVRKGVAAKRRAMKYSEAKYRRDQSKLRRQKYMRDYMRGYRAKSPT